MSSFEDVIWSNEAPAAQPLAQANPWCLRCRYEKESQETCQQPTCRAQYALEHPAPVQNQASTTAPIPTTVPIANQPATAVTVPAPTALPVIPDQTTPLVKAAAALADATTARDRLMRKIEGLELSLQTAKTDLVAAEQTRAFNQAALKKLVEEAL